MTYLSFSSKADFDTFHEAVNEKNGYPKPGVNAATGQAVNIDHAPTRDDPRGWTVETYRSGEPDEKDTLVVKVESDDLAYATNPVVVYEKDVISVEDAFI